MRILITGVCGMIGSELARQFTAQGHEIIGNDDLSHNCVEPKELDIQMFTCRVSQLGFFAGALKPDLIIHCASPVGHARLTPEAEIAWQIISDTQAMLDLTQRTGAKLIVFSSSEVLTYKGETDIRAQYALGKLTGEAMVLGHPRVDGRVIRPYNVTGGHQRSDGGFVMARFRDQLKAGQPLTVFGSGEQVRHFTHVSDFARFVLLLAKKWPERKRWCVFNPTNGTSINALAGHMGRLCAQQAGHRWDLATVKWHRDLGDVRSLLGNPEWRDTSERQLDMAEYEACLELGWAPRVTLGQIIWEHLKGKLDDMCLHPRTYVARQGITGLYGKEVCPDCGHEGEWYAV